MDCGLLFVRHNSSPDLAEFHQIQPQADLCDGLGVAAGHLQFHVDSAHDALILATDLEKPVHIDVRCTVDVAKRRTAASGGDLDPSVIVLSSDQLGHWVLWSRETEGENFASRSAFKGRYLVHS